MALKKTITILGDIEIKDAYLRVERISISNKNQLDFLISGRKTLESPIASSTPHQCPYDINGKNPIAQAYEYVKTLPQYSDAVDC
jgi:hypothetical protein